MYRGKYCGLGLEAGYQGINLEKRAANGIREGRLLYLNLFLFLFITPKFLDSHVYSI
jgi:hypothetical protein